MLERLPDRLQLLLGLLGSRLQLRGGVLRQISLPTLQRAARVAERAVCLVQVPGQLPHGAPERLGCLPLPDAVRLTDGGQRCVRVFESLRDGRVLRYQPFDVAELPRRRVEPERLEAGSLRLRRQDGHDPLPSAAEMGLDGSGVAAERAAPSPAAPPSGEKTFEISCSMAW